MAKNSDYQRIGDVPGEIKSSILMGHQYESVTNEDIILMDLKDLIGHMKLHYQEYLKAFEEAGGTMEFNEEDWIATYTLNDCILIQHFEPDGQYGRTFYGFDFRDKDQQEDARLIFCAMAAYEFIDDADDECSELDRASLDNRHQANLQGVQAIGGRISEDVAALMAALSGTKIERAESSRRFYP